MNYGCGSSGAFTYDMIGVYEKQFRYHKPRRRNRDDYTAIGWYELLKEEIRVNRPVHYRISGHSLVADGWEETGSGPTRSYHMNYGHGRAGDTTWYTLDAHPGYDINEDYLLENIWPAPALGTPLSGTYPRESFPYRYFNIDATSDSTTFAAGQHLQFLPDIRVTCVGTGGKSISFNGTSSNNTRLFSIKGTLTGGVAAGIRIYNGDIKLYYKGRIGFH
jgi:hypothetical protein